MICNNLFSAKPYLDHENYMFKSLIECRNEISDVFT